ncbi:MAG: hypothetical protein R3F62_24360 [Planctomycetota bacterium]
MAGKKKYSPTSTPCTARGGGRRAWAAPSWRKEVEAHLERIETRRKRELASLTVASDVAPLRRSVKHRVFPVQRSVASS